MRPIRQASDLLARNWIIAAVFTAGLAVRVITMLGFPPAIWFAGDSISYVNSALDHSPGISRESGYSLLLLGLEPLHSFAVVTGFQHLLGLAAGAGIYALLRRRGLPRWGAALAAAPVLLDAYQIQLEQEMLPDTGFGFCVVAAVVAWAWWPDGHRPAWASGLAALALALAALCWPVGLPLLIGLLAALVWRRAGWRGITAAVTAGAVPLVLYLGWYHHEHHRWEFSSSSGAFLWARTMTFANCAVIKPPPDERALCPNEPVSQRPAAGLWMWQKDSPLKKMPGKFSATTDRLAGNFARRAIEAQPLGYAGAVLDDFGLTFDWNRPPHPNALMSERYQFTLATHDWDHHGTKRAAAILRIQRAYTDGHTAFTRAVTPFSTFMIDYQKVLYLRGTMTGLLLLLGLAAVGRAWRGGGFRRRRDWGGPALLPALTGLAILLVPSMTADFSLRYMVPAVPVVATAAALLFLRPAPQEEPSASVRATGSERSAGPERGPEDRAGPLPA